jgi:hypothetical protein
MPKKSEAGELVRLSAKDVPRATKADLERLHKAMKGPIDTSDIPERTAFNRIKRDAKGRLPKRQS